MKDLNYWKNNAEEDYIKTPISVLKYITELEKNSPKINPIRDGSVVKVIHCFHGHEFKIGEKVTLLGRDVESWRAKNEGGEIWYMTENEFVVIN